jgi:hypothetical protein
MTVIWPIRKAKMSSDWDFYPRPLNFSHIWFFLFPAVARASASVAQRKRTPVHCSCTEITERARQVAPKKVSEKPPSNHKKQFFFQQDSVLFMYIIRTERISSKSEIVKIVPKRKYLQIMYLFETFSVCYFHLQLFLNTFDWISFLHACANCSFSCIQFEYNAINSKKCHIC